MGDTSNIVIGWRAALIFSICVPLFMASIMLALRKTEQRANLFLAAFLLAVAIAQGPQIIGFSGFYTVWPGLTYFPFNTVLYVGPLLYLHAYSLMRGGPLGLRAWLLLPGLIQTLYYCCAFLLIGDHEAKWAYNQTFHVPYIVPVETALAMGLIFGSVIMIANLIRRYTVYLESTQSAVQDFDPVWLKRLLVALIIASVLFFVLEIAPFIFTAFSYTEAFPLEFLMTVIVAWLGLEALGRTHYPYPKMPDAPLHPVSSPESQNWAQQGEKLKQTIVDKAWYLEPRLSIRDLARRTGSNETYISRALNQGLNVTFNAFINGLRVEKAQGLIAYNKTNMLDIALSSGFNSKATFNRAFRNHTGLTPSQFKKSQIP